MTSRHPRYVVDPEDPRAPSVELWAAMSEAERAEVVANLPSEFELADALPPEGDVHYEAMQNARDVLRGFFQRTGRRVYVGNDMAVFYPGERTFAPDVFAVVDVALHARDSWVVSVEGKGLDVAVEIMWSGRRAKDLKRNVEKYARLGIREYFVFDRRRLSLLGYRFGDGARVYQRIVPQGGSFACHTLGLELAIEGERLRFFAGGAALPDSAELIARLDARLDAAERRAEDEARRAEDEARRAEDEARRAEDEARRADTSEARLQEVLAELERLKRARD